MKHLLGLVTHFLLLSTALATYEPPFQLISLTPDGGSLTNRQAITAVFNLPAVPLGFDLGTTTLPAEYVPFTLTANNDAGTVPGTLYWVTTSIARFDAATTWPADLKVTVTINPSLKSVSGQTISAEESPAMSYSFTTDQQRVTVQSVSSAQASALTDGKWDAATDNNADGALEVPPDGKVRLGFSFPVDFSSLDLAADVRPLLVLDAQGNSVTGYQLSKCPKSVSGGGLGIDAMTTSSWSVASSYDWNKGIGLSCVEMTFSSEVIKSGQLYEVKIKEGARTSKLSGPAGSTSSDDIRSRRITGLRAFKFAAKDYASPTSYKRQRLYLRHGLAAGVTAEQLLAQFAFNPAVNNLSAKLIDKATLQVSGDFSPSVSYTLSVSASSTLKDGFGLALQASDVKFSTSGVNRLILSGLSGTPAAYPQIALTGASFDFSVLYRPGQDDPYGGTVKSAAVGATPVGSTDKSISSLLARLVDNYNGDRALSTAPSTTDILASVGSDKLGTYETTLALDTAETSGRTHFVETKVNSCSNSNYCWNQATSALLSFPSVEVTYALSDTTATDPQVAVFVRQLADQAPVAGATVDVWYVTRDYNGNPPTVTKKSSSTTDSDGLASVTTMASNNDWRNVLYLVVRLTSGEVFVSDPLSLPYANAVSYEGTGLSGPSGMVSSNQVDGATTTDRLVYKPADSIAFKGYVTVRTSACPKGATGPCLVQEATGLTGLRVVAKFQWGSSGQQCSLKTFPLSDLGSFGGLVEIPADADYGAVPDPTLFLLSATATAPSATEKNPCWWNPSDKSINIGSRTASGQLLIADPRPPSALLTLDSVPPVWNPAGAFKLEGSFATYTGVPLQASVSLRVEVTLQAKPLVTGDQILSSGADAPTIYLRADTRTVLLVHTIESDAEGKFSVDLAALPTAADMYTLTNGDDVKVTVTARGLTGESIDASETAVVDSLSYTVSGLQTHPSQPLPGRLFTAKANIAAHPRVTPATPAGTPAIKGYLLRAVDAVRGGSSAGGKRRLGMAIEQTSISPSFVSGRPGGKPWTGGSSSYTESDDTLCRKALVLTSTGAVDTAAMVASGKFELADECADLMADGACSLTLAAVSQYLLVAQLDTAEGSSVSCQILGKSEAEWKSAPLKDWTSGDASLSPALDKDEYAVGDNIDLTFFNPFPDTTTTSLLAFFSSGSQSSVTLPAADATTKLTTVSVGTVPKGCAGGCTVSLFLSAPLAGATGTAADLSATVTPLPETSPLLPTFGPQSASGTISLNVKLPGAEPLAVTGLDIAVKKAGIAVEEAAPGDSVDVVVNVPNPFAAANQAAQLEVTVFVVDKSMLDLRPLALLDAATALDVKEITSTVSGVVSSLSRTASPEGYAAARTALLSRLGLDPWVTLGQWPLLPVQDASSLFGSDEEFLSSLFGTLTNFPASAVTPYYNGGDYDDGMYAPEMAAGGAGGAVMDTAASAPNAMADSMARPGAAESAGPTDKSSMNTATKAPADAAASGAAPSGMKIRSEFARLVAFETKTVTVAAGAATGSATVSVKLPDNEGTFVLRAVAVVKKAKSGAESTSALRFGSSESSVKSTKTAYLKPLLPRIIRSGDLVDLGVVLTVSPAFLATNPQGLTVEVVSISGPLALGKDVGSSKSVKPSTTSTEVTFRMSAAKGVGKVTLIFALKDGGNDVDVVQDTVEVLPPQQAVVFATSMSIDPAALGDAAAAAADKEVLWTERVTLPPVIPGLGGLNITAGVGFSSALVNLGRAYRDQNFVYWDGTDVAYPSGDALIAAIHLRHVLKTVYSVSSPEIDAMADRAEELLPKYLDTNGLGLLYRPLSEVQQYYTWMRLDLGLNALALFAEKATGNAVLSGLKSSIENQVKSAIQQRVNEYYAHDAPKYSTLLQYVGVYEQALLRAALGTTYAWGLSATDEIKLSFTALRVEVRDSTTWAYSDAAYLVASMVVDLEGEDSTQPKTIANAALKNVRIQGPTVYIASGAGGDWPIGDSSQALALRLWSQMSKYKAHPFAAKLGVWLAQGGMARRNPWLGCFYSTPLVFTTAALSALDKSTSSDDPNVSLKVTAGDAGAELFSETFVKGAAGPFEEGYGWPDLAAKVGTEVGAAPPALAFHVKGTGSVLATLGMRFVPTELIASPTFKGLLVQKSVQAYDAVKQRCTGDAKETAESGQSVCITIQVTTADYQQGVSIEDPLPAGLEAEDPNLSNANTAGPVNYWGGLGLTGRYSGRWFYWAPFCSRTTRADQVSFSCSSLPPGQHTFQYVATANIAGVFSLPPAHAYVDSNPEVMGLSGGSRFAVFKSTAVSTPVETDMQVFALFGETQTARRLYFATPKDCGECPVGGSCDPQSGVCKCTDTNTFQTVDCAALNDTPVRVASEQDVFGETGGDTTIPGEDVVRDVNAGGKGGVTTAAPDASSAVRNRVRAMVFGSVFFGWFVFAMSVFRGVDK